MTELSDDEIDHSEGLIPMLAASATNAAYLRAVAAGYTLIVEKGGLLVRIEPDGSETPLRASSMKHKVTAGKVFRLNSLLPSQPHKSGI